ncbi:hypothetical protein BVC80_8677g8 [Macleaya cordata]|uniref:Reverse transcriptase domain-containing protein n=1 Tax=Macleaya cordata TaxID=56857 RepID=A0A200Q0W3_MACCD|nr:hypothetical protein BVC80_8677g8 [Macleaya cordata]
MSSGGELSFLESFLHNESNNDSLTLTQGLDRGFFPSFRSFRQGDPLSLTLFVLAIDILSRGLKKYFEEVIFLNGRKSSLDGCLDFLIDTAIA